MNKLEIYEININTQQHSIREMTDEEYTQYLIDLEQINIEKQKQQELIQAEEAKNNAKREALRALGMSEDAIDAILN